MGWRVAARILWLVGCVSAIIGGITQNLGVMASSIVLILLSFVAAWLSFRKGE